MTNHQITATEITDDEPSHRPCAAASRYQQLRGHLAALRLHTAAEQLPAVLDHATAEGLSVTAALERLLASRGRRHRSPPARRPAPVRLPAHPRHPGRLRLRRRHRASTGTSSPSSAPAATSNPPPT